MPINIVNKRDCCGCKACGQICPTECISIVADEEGFWYPSVDETKCINCGRCEKVCPQINKKKEVVPKCIYAAKNEQDKIRMKSSSGGVFSIFAEHIIRMGGVVFGACFDKNWNVVHDYTSDILGLEKFRGSKYVQSDVGSTYTQALRFLKEGRHVLFSGTPCQIKALKLFLGKEYENLFTIEVVCHSVPSPEVWRKYVKERSRDYIRESKIESEKSYTNITDIRFRDKRYGWKKYSLSFSFDKKEKVSSIHYEDPYFKLFAADLIVRPSCSNCMAKSGRSNADVAIADYWWINELHHEYDDDKGISLLYLYSDKGVEFANTLIRDKIETFTKKDIEEAYLFEGAYSKSTTLNPLRKKCFELLQTHDISDIEVQRLAQAPSSQYKNIAKALKNLLKLMGIFKLVKRLYKRWKK